MMFSRQLHGLLLALLAMAGSFTGESVAQTNNLSGQTDDSIRNVLTLVANRQRQRLGVLADGDYTPVFTTNAATAATKPKGIQWEYGWGVTLYGLLQAKNATGNADLEDYVINHNLVLGRYYCWLESLKSTVTNATSSWFSTFYSSTALGEFIRLGSPGYVGKLDYCGSMTASVLEGALFHAGYLTNEQAMLAQKTADWVNYGQSRLPDGTLWRPERDNGTIWADDLYMSCPFLIRWYQYTGNTNYLDDAVRQVLNMAGYLQDTNGIWYHGYNVSTNSVNGFKWGRANGWSLITQAEILSILPTNHPARSNLLSIFTRHVEGLKAVQAQSGMWRQVLDHPELWEETSCTAMFAYAIARGVNRGWIDPTNMAVARKAFVGVCQNISTNGVISNICIGTAIGYNLDYYMNRPRANDDQRGVGAVMLAAAEILSSPRLNIVSSNDHVVVDWPAAVPANCLQTSTNLADWAAFTGSVAAGPNWRNVATDGVTDRRFYRLRHPPPSYPPPILAFEAEWLAWTTNGAAATVSSVDTNASGGRFVTFFADNASDYIEFTITNVAAGTYRLKMSFKAQNNRGRMNLAVDGSPLGALDQYWPTNFYPIADFGPVTFGTAANHALRLTVTGRSVASTGYTLTADKFLLFPLSQ